MLMKQGPIALRLSGQSVLKAGAATSTRLVTNITESTRSPTVLQKRMTLSLKNSRQPARQLHRHCTSHTGNRFTVRHRSPCCVHGAKRYYWCRRPRGRFASMLGYHRRCNLTAVRGATYSFRAAYQRPRHRPSWKWAIAPTITSIANRHDRHGVRRHLCTPPLHDCRAPSGIAVGDPSGHARAAT